MEGGKMLGTVVVCTVCLSIVAHGVTAIPISKAIEEKIVRHKK
jgi:NhaP-type Na+/H+ or K+/H+ antiporter